MKYAPLNFTLYNNQPVVIQGDQALYTYQNTGSNTGLIQGSNDTVTWFDILSLAASSSDIKEHSYAYLRLVGNTTVRVNRGSINNIDSNPGNGNGGTFDFAVEDLDLNDSATIVPSAMELIPNTETEQELIGTAQIGQINTLASPPYTVNSYFKAQKGIFNFDITEQTDLYLINVANQPVTKIFMQDLASLLPANIVSITYNATAEILDVMLGEITAGNDSNQANIHIDSILVPILISFKITGRLLECYVNGEKKGELNFTQLLPFWQTIDMSEDGNYLTQLNYDLSQLTGSLTYDLSMLTDGTYYKLEHNLNLFGKSINQGDFAQFYNNKTGVIVYPQ